jgi:hypothetical protein
MNNLTGNVNMLSTNSFKLVINSNRFANTEFFTVSANLPGISLNESIAGFRNKAGYVPGDKLIFEPLTIRIAVDENLENYMELFSWLQKHVTSQDLEVVDMSLVILSSHNNPVCTFTFVNAFPTNLGQIDFNSQQGEVEYAYVDVTFRYDYFKISRAGSDSICP